jgi:hypothetical protein
MSIRDRLGQRISVGAYSALTETHLALDPGLLSRRETNSWNRCAFRMISRGDVSKRKAQDPLSHEHESEDHVVVADSEGIAKQSFRGNSPGSSFIMSVEHMGHKIAREDARLLPQATPSPLSLRFHFDNTVFVWLPLLISLSCVTSKPLTHGSSPSLSQPNPDSLTCHGACTTVNTCMACICLHCSTCT